LYRVQIIHGYLGDNRGNNPDTWKGLTGNIRKNNEDLQKLLTQMGCDIWKLQNPTAPGSCPPGGPGTVPSKPPTYPP
jgi:hypothetical protein